MKRELRGLAVDISNAQFSTFMASTTQMARDGLVIPSSAWRTDSYMANPVVLANHDYSSMPIGRTVNLQVVPDGLIAKIEWDMDDPAGALAASKVKRGFANAVSVGWNTLQQTGNVVDEADLLDVSLVSVPSDPGAIAIQRSVYATYERHKPARGFYDFSDGPDDDDDEERFVGAFREQNDLKKLRDAIRGRAA
jgi:HK97 family phage prohead protease